MSHKVPHYCTRCGQFLVEQKTLSGYDPYTGDKVFNTRLVCPEKHESWACDTDSYTAPSWYKERYVLT